MRRHLSCFSLVLAASLAACSDDPKPAATDTVAPDTTPDVTADVSGDDALDTVAPDTQVAPDTTEDTTPETTPDTSPGEVTPTGGGPGDPCVEASDCSGPSPTCLSLPDGYCAPDCSTDGCPDGSVCYEFQDGGKMCLRSCEGNTDCRVGDDHICDTDNTCWWYEGTTPGSSPIGGTCKSDSDCLDTGATCYAEGFDGGANGFIGGYCLIFDCTTCPTGASCISVTNAGDTACFEACDTDNACRTGYHCTADDETCWPGCESDAECPEGYGCSEDAGGCVFGWSSEPFVCDDQRFEPNEIITKAKAIEAPSVTTGLDLCAGDEDWFSVEAPVATLTTVGIEFPHVRGDLDLIAFDERQDLLGSRLGPATYSAAYRTNENGLEYHAILGMAGPVKGYFNVHPFAGATNQYDLHVTTAPWQDGPLCSAGFGFDECRGYNGTSTGIVYHFPFARADDPYVPDGYRLESYSSYRWLRRELIMLVRHAIHAVQKKFPHTTPLGLLDMGDKFAVTPGFDVGDPRHPESTHDQGGNIDIAYYQTDGDNDGQIVCGANENLNNDGYYCTSTAGNVLDAPRTAYFMAVLNLHPRLRVIGVDAMLAPLIQAEARKQRDNGDITAKQYSDLVANMASGDGWPFHHHHMHVSLRWWGDDAPQPNGLVYRPEPPIGCGFRMPGDGPLLR